MRTDPSKQKNLATKKNSLTIAALIVAAGKGSRAGKDIPKQYCKIGDQMVLGRTASLFCQHPAIDFVQCVIAEGDAVLYHEAVVGLPVRDPVVGGSTRQRSVHAGLEALAVMAPPPDIILIHDAARPFCPAALIDRLIVATYKYGAVVPTLKIADALICSETGYDSSYHVDHHTLRHVQTPQAFHFTDILSAHRKYAGCSPPATDDAVLLEWAGQKVRLVPGSEKNFKITWADDFEKWENPQKEKKAMISCSGQGFDVHGFTKGDHVILCGVKIPHHAGLSGYSDADVALHALSDALLGSIAEDDIGVHFPPSDPRWKGADSSIFLNHALNCIKERGGYIRQVDVTIICEAPKINTHRLAMKTRLTNLLSLPISRVSVKATTTEGLGFTGRQEGIAAMAIATVCLPCD